MDKEPLSGYELAKMEEEKNNEDYSTLRDVLNNAFDRASKGKGKERHSAGEPFHEQPMCRAIYMCGEHAWDGQVLKKMIEADRLSPEAGDNELLDCINYIAGRIVARRKHRKNGNICPS